MADKIVGKYPSVSFRVKAFIHADNKIKLVGDDPDLPNNGMFITVKPDTDSDRNIRQMIDAAHGALDHGEVEEFVRDLDDRELRKMILLCHNQMSERGNTWT